MKKACEKAMLMNPPFFPPPPFPPPSPCAKMACLSCLQLQCKQGILQETTCRVQTPILFSVCLKVIYTLKHYSLRCWQTYTLCSSFSFRFECGNANCWHNYRLFFAFQWWYDCNERGSFHIVNFHQNNLSHLFLCYCLNLNFTQASR